jgi:cytochrome c-type biogenesis protein CcsB
MTSTYAEKLRWPWAALILLGTFYALMNFTAYMDDYEIGILIASALGFIWLGFFWPSFRPFSLWVSALSLLAIFIYGYNGLESLKLQETNFFLKFLISSQSAIMWMSALYFLATVFYFFALFRGSEFVAKSATALTWTATVMGMTGLMVRWFESYLISPEIGRIPVSNLYEVFILFAVMTALLYLYYEQKSLTRHLGGFVLLIISAAIGFLLWYTFDREAYHIQPLVPALNSYWMKIHVPANFVGYGTFAIAAMVAIAYLIKDSAIKKGKGENWTRNLPSLELMDDVMYKAIALGFAFFTIATVLGAMWAAEAWGGYWSWDPKETWALIVWLNYAAWLHLRLTKGWSGRPMAWWSVVGLFITTFAFLGVNMFLSGLHSYGEL